MALLLALRQNLPAPLLYELNTQMNVPISRVGDFFDQRKGPGCGTLCIWNGAGYYAEGFTCGKTYPSGATFYCSVDCHQKVGESSRVFLSYRWADVDIADRVTTFCRGAGIDLLRDIRQIKLLDSIRDFMDTAGASRYFVAIVTDTYFLSRYCLYEFVQLCESDLEIRTIPIVLGDAASHENQAWYEQYWRDVHDRLSQAVATLDPRYGGYLDTELHLLERGRYQIAKFLSDFRDSGLPAGEWWLSSNCRYLVGTITTTFQPAREDASNWTFSNRRVRGAEEEEPPIALLWDPGPCHIHVHSESRNEALRVLPSAEMSLRSVHDERKAISPEPGVHVVLIDQAFLLSLPLCQRLQQLSITADVELVPIFLDPRFTKPASEVTVLAKWSERLSSGDFPGGARHEIDEMLTGLGPLVASLRDRVAPMPRNP